jgi:hypothetical protein
MDPDRQKKAIEERAYALWEAAGRPPGGDLMYWLIAEQEIEGRSVVGEEDPGAALGDLQPGDVAASASRQSTDAPLRTAVENAVPEPEQLPSGEAENPISRQVRDVAETGDRAKP